MNVLKTIADVARASAFGACLRFDTLLKIAKEFWSSWGIQLDANDPEAQAAAIDGYRVEWTQTGPEHHAAVAEGAKRSGLGDANALMNRKMAEMLYHGIRLRNLPRHDHSITIMDLGCGPGGSVRALLEHLDMTSAEVRTILVEPSSTVQDAAKAVRQMHFDQPIIENKLVEEWLPDADLSEADVLLFGASVHHMNVGMVLSQLKQKLPKGAIIGVAEWTHAMLKSPAHFRVLVQNLDALVEPGILARYDAIFPDGARTPDATCDDVSPLLSMAGGFWPNHATACLEKMVKPMFSPFEGHVPWPVWKERFERHGFKTLEVAHLNPDNKLHTIYMFEKE